MLYEPFGASCLRMWTAVLLRPQLSHSLHARCLLPRKCADPLTSVDLASKRVWWIRRCEYGLLTHQRSAPRSATSPALAAPRTGLAGCKRLAVLRAVHRGHKHSALSLFGFISRSSVVLVITISRRDQLSTSLMKSTRQDSVWSYEGKIPMATCRQRSPATLERTRLRGVL